MRSRPSLAVLLVAALAAVTFVVGAGAPPTIYAAPAGCVASASGVVLACDHVDPVGRGLGSIGLVGDSVLLGSTPGMSTPSLPALLAARGWGPIRMTTSLGMRTYNASNVGASAYHVLAKWKAAGFTPRVVVVNLGANHFLDCTNATLNVCIGRITQVLDQVRALYPSATVWWAKTNARSLITGGYQPGMLSWNLALDRVAAARPTQLVVWDWPSALVANHILTDPSQIHPVNGTQYAVRSRLIADDVTSRMPTVWNRVSVVPPDNTSAPLRFTPLPPAKVFEHNGATPLVARVSVPVRIPVAVPGDPPAKAAALSVTVGSAAGLGQLLVTGNCASTTGTVIHLVPGQRRTVQAIVPLDATGQFCLRSNVTTGVVVTLQGTFSSTATSRLTPVTPTRIAAFASAAATVAVPGGAGLDGAAITLAVDARNSTAGGTIAVSADCSGTPPQSAGVIHASYLARGTVSAQVFVPLDGLGNFCVYVDAGGALPTVYVLDTGHFSSTGRLGYRPVAVTRVLQMGPTVRIGGWSGRLFPRQAVSELRAPATAEAVSMVVTGYDATAPGAVTAWRRGATSVTAAQGLFYFPAALASSNTLTIGVTPNAGYAIGDMGNAIERLAIDVVGWWVR